MKVEHVEHTSSLFGGEPIAHSNAKSLGTFDPSNSGGEVRTEQPGVSGLICKAADRRGHTPHRSSADGAVFALPLSGD